ncbi:MAG: helix-turn-helix transcriptional regulator [Acidobacteriaceae bacterium]|nr:helix-turn-helix transcriptional regulator [Acidobacteriaceae bacterium]
MADVCEQLGDRIRELRKKRGWRQVDLAQHSKVHEVHLSDLERGTREAGLKTIAKIAEAFEIKISELMTGIRDPDILG